MTQILDAQAALNFVVSQRSHIESQVLAKEYPEIQYPRMIPVDTSAGAYSLSVTHFTQDTTGNAKYVNGSGDDIPLVNIMRNKFEQTVDMGAIGYQFTREEIGAAQQQGRSLSSEGAIAARDEYERFVNEMALIGPEGSGGLFTMPGITTSAAAQAFSAATPQQILETINGQITTIYSATNGVELADTVVLPLDQYGDIVTRQLAPESETTVMDFIQRKNVYTMRTGQPLMIEASHLADKMIVYKRDPSAVKMHMPMPLTFIEPQSVNLNVRVLGMFRFALPNIRKPGAFRYVTGV